MIRVVKPLPLAAVLLGLSLFGLTTQNARAGIIPYLNPLYPQSDGAGHFIFDYSVDIPGNYQVKPGDSFTIYDFNGYVPGSATLPNADWSVSVALTTPPVGLPAGAVMDDASVPNITYSYVGAGIPVQASDTWLVITAKSTTGAVFDPPDSFRNVASATHNGNGGPADEVSNTTVPKASNGTPQAPEPATLAMLGVGMPLLGAFNWLRRRKTSTTK